MPTTKNPRHQQIEVAKMRGEGRKNQPIATAEALYPDDTELANAFREGWNRKR
jgi:hypothetical protein